MNAILIVQTGFLGDAVLASAMVRAVAEARPDARLGVLVRTSVAELFEIHPAIGRVHSLDKRSTSIAAIAAEIAGASYDAALVPHRSLRSALIVVRAGVPVRVGFDAADAPWLFTSREPYRIAEHETVRNARLVARVVAPAVPTPPRSWLVPTRNAVLELRRRFGENSVVLVAPGSVWATKRWIPERFAQVARSLMASGRRVLLIGSPDERALCASVAAAAGMPPEDNLAGSTTPGELLALCAIAERVITNDSAALHVAEAVGTPVTAIFGPTVPEFGFGPRLEGSVTLGRDDLPCRPCRIHGGDRCPIDTHACMTQISTDEVLATVR